MNTAPLPIKNSSAPTRFLTDGWAMFDCGNVWR